MPAVVAQVGRRQATVTVGSDVLSMVAFRGDTTAPFDSNVAVWGAGSQWAASIGRNARTSDVAIAHWRPDAVYVVMLAERDGSLEIDEADLLGAWRSQMALVWHDRVAGLLRGDQGPATEPQRSEAAQSVGQALLGLASAYLQMPQGDHRMGQPQRVFPAPGKPYTAVFNGEVVHHVVTFTVAS